MHRVLRAASSVLPPLMTLMSNIACTASKAEPGEDSSMGGDNSSSDAGLGGTTSGASSGGAGSGGTQAGTSSPDAALGGSAGSVGTGRVPSAAAPISSGLWRLMDLVGSEGFALGYMLGGVHGQRRTWNDEVTAETNLLLSVDTAFVNRQLLHSMAYFPEDEAYYLVGETDGPWAGEVQSDTVDQYVAKLSEAGEVIWADQLGGPDDTRNPPMGAQDILAVDFEGAVYLAERPLNSIPRLEKRSRDGEVLWSLQPDLHELSGRSGRSLARVTFTTSESGVTFAWVNEQPSDGVDVTHDWILSRIEPDGTITFTTVYDDACWSDRDESGSSVFALAVTPDASKLMALGTCLSQLDGDGNLLWSEGRDERYWRAAEALNRPIIQHYAIVVSEDLDAFYTLTPPIDAESNVASVPSVVTGYSGDGSVLWESELEVRGTQFQIDPKGEFVALWGEALPSGDRSVLRIGTEEGEVLDQIE